MPLPRPSVQPLPVGCTYEPALTCQHSFQAANISGNARAAGAYLRQCSRSRRLSQAMPAQAAPISGNARASGAHLRQCSRKRRPPQAMLAQAAPTSGNARAGGAHLRQCSRRRRLSQAMPAQAALMDRTCQRLYTMPEGYRVGAYEAILESLQILSTKKPHSCAVFLFEQSEISGLVRLPDQ